MGEVGGLHVKVQVWVNLGQACSCGGRGGRCWGWREGGAGARGPASKQTSRCERGGWGWGGGREVQERGGLPAHGPHAHMNFIACTKAPPPAVCSQHCPMHATALLHPPALHALRFFSFSLYTELDPFTHAPSNHACTLQSCMPPHLQLGQQDARYIDQQGGQPAAAAGRAGQHAPRDLRTGWGLLLTMGW